MTNEIQRNGLNSIAGAVRAQIGRRTNLMDLPPVSDLISLIEGFENQPQKKTSENDAKRLTEMLAGAYPHAKATDIYKSHIAIAFSESDPRAAAKAIDIILSENKFIPTVAELKEKITEVSNARLSVYRQAKAMIVEHKRRNDAQKREEKIERDRKEWREKHGEKSPLEVYAPGLMKAKKI